MIRPTKPIKLGEKIMEKKEKICVVCQKPFIATGNNQKKCSTCKATVGDNVAQVALAAPSIKVPAVEKLVEKQQITLETLSDLSKKLGATITISFGK
jgi:tRNA(Ile2) C34 agmatinyltransferase TiaS